LMEKLCILLEEFPYFDRNFHEMEKTRLWTKKKTGMIWMGDWYIDWLIDSIIKLGARRPYMSFSMIID
jgi:hypothetical protein